MTPRFPIYQGVVYDRDGPKDAVVRTASLRAAQTARLQKVPEIKPMKI